MHIQKYLPHIRPQTPVVGKVLLLLYFEVKVLILEFRAARSELISRVIAHFRHFVCFFHAEYSILSNL